MKNKILTLLFVLSSCNCEDQTELVRIDGQPCVKRWDGQIKVFSEIDPEFEWSNAGECQTGIYKATEEGDFCIGTILPNAESCNNLDDDCDGEIDEDVWLDRDMFDYDNDCRTKEEGVCKLSTQECINGEYVCVYPDLYGEEVCDGLDNDCDGKIDEDTPEEPMFVEDRYVYVGPEETINVGECRSGYKECVNGRVNVRNMRTPIQEVCGNDDDDDCDGLTDEDEDGPNVSDYLFIIDFSGSMSDVIDSVSTALCNWSSQGTLAGSRFAVIAIGYCNNYPCYNDEMVLLTDFTDAQTACEIVSDNNQSWNAGGSEYQIDATLRANTPSNPLSVSWGSNTKKVLIFSDEDMQYLNFQNPQSAVNAVVQQCTEKQYTLSAFIGWDSNPQLLWVEMIQRCNGFLDYLDSNPYDMVETLNYWIGEQC